ncbi:MAG: hypothetical protein AB1566_13640 [Chloroflexota bacterium]
MTPIMTQAPFAYLYSDLPGVGVHSVWTYHGPALEGPIQELWGIEPDLGSGSLWNDLKDGYQSGHPEGGIILPKNAQAGDTVRWVHKLQTRQWSYGAVLQFVLRQGPKGFEPTNISVQTLPPE